MAKFKAGDLVRILSTEEIRKSVPNFLGLDDADVTNQWGFQIDEGMTAVVVEIQESMDYGNVHQNLRCAFIGVGGGLKYVDDYMVEKVTSNIAAIHDMNIAAAEYQKLSDDKPQDSQLKAFNVGIAAGLEEGVKIMTLLQKRKLVDFVNCPQDMGLGDWRQVIENAVKSGATDYVVEYPKGEGTLVTAVGEWTEEEMVSEIKSRLTRADDFLKSLDKP